MIQSSTLCFSSISRTSLKSLFKHDALKYVIHHFSHKTLLDIDVWKISGQWHERSDADSWDNRATVDISTLTEWANWSSCSTTCSIGSRTRPRTCLTGCDTVVSSDLTDVGTCNEGLCKVDLQPTCQNKSAENKFKGEYVAFGSLNGRIVYKFELWYMWFDSDESRWKFTLHNSPSPWGTPDPLDQSLPGLL